MSAPPHGVHVAMLWLAEGVLLRDDIAVPSPPPSRWMLDVRPPFNFFMRPASRFTAPPPLAPEAEFELHEWSETGEVAHYYLRSGPPAGYRWIVRNRNLELERT